MNENEARQALAGLMAQQPEAFEVAVMLAREGETEAAARYLAEWDTAYINDLPDSAFAYIEPGGTKEDGKTSPRSKRHFPHHNAEGGLDLPHLRNALSRAPQSPFGPKVTGHLRGHAGKAGVGEQKASEVLLGSNLELAVGKPITLIREGKWEHPDYGEFEVTAADIDRMVANFEANVTKQQAPIDIDHDHSRGAVGWLQRVFRSADEQGRAVLRGIVDWTEDGAKLVGKAFKHTSIHYDPDYEDAESGENFGPTIRSASITNFPFVKDMEPISLSEFKERIKEVDMSDDILNLSEEDKGMLQRVLSLFRGEQKEEPKPDVKLAEVEAVNLKLREQVDAQQKELAEIKTVQRRARFMELMEKGRWIGDRDTSLKLMETLADTKGEDSDEFKAYAAQQTAHADQVWQSDLFKEKGTSAPSPSQSERMQAELTEIREGLKLAADADGSSKALAEYYRRHPEEYVQTQRDIERRKKEA